MSEKKASEAPAETTSSPETRKKESLTDQLTETFSELTESISQVRSNRRRASMPPTDTIPVVPAASEDAPPAPKVVGNGKTSMMHNPVAFGFLMTVGVGLALFAYYIFNNVGALVGWVTGAIFIALGLDPIVRRLESWGIKRGIGVIAVLAGFAGAVTGLVMTIGPVISEQASKFVQYAPGIYQNTIDSDWYHELDQRFSISTWVNENVPKFLESTFSSSQVNSFMSSLVSAGSTLAQSVTGVIIVLFLSLYFLTSMDTIKAWGVRLAPASKRVRVKYITDKITESVGNYVMGQAMVAILNALFAFFIMLFLGRYDSGVHSAGWWRDCADFDLADSADSGLESGAVVCGGVLPVLAGGGVPDFSAYYGSRCVGPCRCCDYFGGCRWRAMGRAGRADCYSGGGFHADSGA